MNRIYLVFAISCCVAYRPAVAAPIQKPTGLYVIACGSGKLAVYWDKVKGAKGYYIYRRTKSTRYNFKKPAEKLFKVPDSFAGSPMKLWVSYKLVTGREYFYVIKAVDSKGRLSAASVENSDVVDPSAIPWDSRDPKKIVDAAAKAANDSAPDEETKVGPNDEFAVGGPDGMTYRKYKGRYSKDKPDNTSDFGAFPG